MNRVVVACALLLLPLSASACGGGTSTSTEVPTTTPAGTTTAPAPKIELTVFRVEDGTLHAETVRVPKTTATAAASLQALGVPAKVTIADGTATVDLADATGDQVAEIVYTLTQYPSIERVDVAGKRGLTRDSIGSMYLAPIVVESPASGATVAKTFHVTGLAQVFEATLVVELVQDGKVAVKESVTASEGAPGRGTFDAVVTAPATGAAKVVAFAPSAEDGSPQHEVQVPVTVTP